MDSELHKGVVDCAPNLERDTQIVSFRRRSHLLGEEYKLRYDSAKINPRVCLVLLHW
jgi:hypothetical protein